MFDAQDLAALCTEAGQLVPRYERSGVRRRVHGAYLISIEWTPIRCPSSISCTVRRIVRRCCSPRTEHHRRTGKGHGARDAPSRDGEGDAPHS